MRLEGQVAIVTGGGGGIGKATCLTFAREGADIVIPEVNIANAEAASAEIQALGRKCKVIDATYCCSLSRDAFIERPSSGYAMGVDLVSDTCGYM